MKIHIILRDMVNEEIEIDDKKFMPFLQDLQDPEKQFMFFQFSRLAKQSLINKRDIIKVEWRLESANSSSP